jgi:hypothetical protein
MNINEILTTKIGSISIEDQKVLLEQMKEKKIFDLNESEMENFKYFLCEIADTELAIDYLFHVLDTEVSYPIDDVKIKSLFSNDKMLRMKDLMMEKLHNEEESSESNAENTVYYIK